MIPAPAVDEIRSDPMNLVEDERKIRPGELFLHLGFVAFTMLGCDVLHHMVG